MRKSIFAATAISAIWILPGAAQAAPQGTPPTAPLPPSEGTRGGIPQAGPQDEALPGSEPAPAQPAPDVRDYQAPAESVKSGVPAVPPGAVETPSTSPAEVEPAAGSAAVPQGYQPLEAYLKADNGKRSQLARKPVVLRGGEAVGTLSGFVVRDGVHYAHLSLPETANDRGREVVAGLDKLFVSADGNTIMVDVRSRAELEDLPEYQTESYQRLR